MIATLNYGQWFGGTLLGFVLGISISPALNDWAWRRKR